jgi:hypothetical protein
MDFNRRSATADGLAGLSWLESHAYHHQVAPRPVKKQGVLRSPANTPYRLMGNSIAVDKPESRE